MCAPNEIRTRVPGLKSPCPRPLDDRGKTIANFQLSISKLKIRNFLGDQWELNPRPPGPQPGVLTN